MYSFVLTTTNGYFYEYIESKFTWKKHSKKRGIILNDSTFLIDKELNYKHKTIKKVNFMYYFREFNKPKYSNITYKSSRKSYTMKVN